MNKKCNKNLKLLCRMARAWKDVNSVSISGVLIDVLAYNFLSNYDYKDKSYLYYDFISRDFFNYLSNQNSNQSFWYAMGSNRQVHRTGSFEYKAKQAYNKSLEAIAALYNGYAYTAKLTWREIYGSKFPQ